MTNLIIHEYYYNGKSSRKTIKDLVSTDNFTEALDKLNQAITEHDNYLNSKGIPNNGTSFTSVDNLSLKHAKDHLEFVSKDPKQKQSVLDALDE